MRTCATLLACVLTVSAHGIAMAEIHEHGGSANALPHDKYVHGLGALPPGRIRGRGRRLPRWRLEYDFVLGPQGQKRQDLPQGEVLMPAALDALELSVAFVKAPATK